MFTRCSLFFVCLVVCLLGIQTRPTSATYTAQLFDAVHGVALALSDLVNKKAISRSTDVRTVREKLHEKLMSYGDPTTGFPSATGNNRLMYFDQNLDGPPLYDVVNLVVSLGPLSEPCSFSYPALSESPGLVITF